MLLVSLVYHIEGDSYCALGQFADSTEAIYTIIGKIFSFFSLLVVGRKPVLFIIKIPISRVVLHTAL